MNDPEVGFGYCLSETKSVRPKRRRRRRRPVSEVFDLREWRLPRRYQEQDKEMAKMTRDCLSWEERK